MVVICGADSSAVAFLWCYGDDETTGGVGGGIMASFSGSRSESDVRRGGWVGGWVQREREGSNMASDGGGGGDYTIEFVRRMFSNGE